MKRLTLLRHAKSDWDDPVARDFDRATALALEVGYRETLLFEKRRGTPVNLAASP